MDAGRREVFTTEPNARRELMVQIWYPAMPTTSGPSSPRAPYLQETEAFAPALARLFHLPEFAFGHLKYVTTNAMRSAPVAVNERGYPVLIFLEGLSGFRQMNTFQVEALVSHGYIVAAIDQPYAAASVLFPDGSQVSGLSKDEIDPLIVQSLSAAEHAPMLNGQAFKDGIIPYLAQDAIFTLDQLAALNQADPNGILTGRLDLQRIGTFGISLGGIVGSEACRMEPRLRACLLMDAPMPTDVVQAGLRQSSMWITRDAKTMQLEGWPRRISTNTRPPCRRYSRKARPDMRQRVTSCRCKECFTPTSPIFPPGPRFSPGWVSPGRSMNSGRTTPSTPTRWRFLIST